MKNRKRTFAIATAAIATVGLLTACSTGTDTATPSDTATSAAPLERQDNRSAEASFVANYVSEFGYIDSETEGLLIDLGYTVCESLDAGVSVDTIGQTGVSEGIPEYEVGYIVGGAVVDLCPENQPILDEWFANDGDIWNDTTTSNFGA